jgi:hypothetical protein
LIVVAMVSGSLALFIPSHLYAWNDEGHMLVAFIAFRHLTPDAKSGALRLLKLNPQYDSWIADLPSDATDEQRTEAALVRAATWPDFIKGAPGYVADGSDHGNTPPPGPQASQNIGYADKNMHKYWHFIDVPFSDDGTAVSGPPSVNAHTEIERLREALMDPETPDEIKSYDLCWLAHLVGDVHQPLHAVSRFTRADADGDNGGNDVKPLHCSSARIVCASNLHALWDGLLGNDTTAATISSFGTSLDAGTPPAGGDDSDVSAWIAESVVAAERTAYRDPAGQPLGDPDAQISRGYATRAGTAARARVVLAGHRLAALINAALGG